MGIDCLKCINSACCKPVVELNKNEFDRMVGLGHRKHLTTNTEKFINRFPKHKEREAEFNEMYKENFAELNKDENGMCVLLDKDMLCSIYDDRPKVCKDYTTDRCSKIRLIK